MKRIRIIPVVLAFAVCGACCVLLGGCGEEPVSEEYIIEEDAEKAVETEKIGDATLQEPPYYSEMMANDKEYMQSMEAMIVGEEKLFDMMEDSDADFFYLLDEGEEREEAIETEDSITSIFTQVKTVYQTDKAGFIEQLQKCGEFDVDILSTIVGEGVLNFLNEDAESMEKYLSNTKGMFACSREDVTVSDFIKDIRFGKEHPDGYFKSRALDLACEDVKVEKLALQTQTIESENVDTGETTEEIYAYFYAICKGNVTTESCKGDSFFPPAGETDEVTVWVSLQKPPKGVYYCDVIVK